VIPSKIERRELGNRTHTHHDTDRSVSLLACPSCPAWRDAGYKVLGKVPAWYPSDPPRSFLQCPGCALVWDVR
jgi:hypothetical protein